MFQKVAVAMALCIPVREINLPRLDASKIQKIWDEEKENVLVECKYG